MARKNNVDLSKIKFGWFNTGIEYQATVEHLDYLEKKYNIKIERIRAKYPVPFGVKTFGVPFLTKFVSEMIERLQKKGFDFASDGWKSLEELELKYPKTKGALTWWTNSYKVQKGKKKSCFNINTFQGLKEFMISNPPQFNISSKCCQGAKKDVAYDYYKQNHIDLAIVGIRRSEGGVRSVAYKNCFSDNCNKKQTSFYRPIFWFSDKDKNEYCKEYNVVHSRCYTQYGFKRTGCCCCPYGSDFNNELATIEKFEPKLAVAVKNIFGKSYEYTNAYRNFKKKKLVSGQISLFD